MDSTATSIHLGGATVELSRGALELTLAPAAAVVAASAKIRQRYELRAVNAEECRRWAEHLERSVQQLNWRASVASSEPSASPKVADGGESVTALWNRVYDDIQGRNQVVFDRFATDFARTFRETDEELDLIFARKGGVAEGAVDEKKLWAWFASHALRALRQAERLLENLAAAVAALMHESDDKKRGANVASWLAHEYHAIFMRMLDGMEPRAQPVRLNTDMPNGSDSDESPVLSTDEALAVIGWCNRCSERFHSMGLIESSSPVKSTAPFEESDRTLSRLDFGQGPTDTVMYKTLVTQYMPPHRGGLSKPGKHLGWITRYYVLSQGVLRYYKTSAMVAQHGEIPGELMTKVSVVQDSRTDVRLVWGGKVSLLRAATEADASLWCERLCKTRDAAQKVEVLLSSLCCFEVEAFDGPQRQVAVSSVSKACADHYNAAEQKLTLDLHSSKVRLPPPREQQLFQAQASENRAMAYMGVGDVLLEQLEARLERIPAGNVLALVSPKWNPYPFDGPLLIC